MSDATEASVSAKAGEKAMKQDSAIAEAEAAVEAKTSINGEQVDLDPIVGTIDKEEAPKLSPREQKLEDIASRRAEAVKTVGSQPDLSNDDLGLPEGYSAQGGTVKLKVKGKEIEVSSEKVLDAGIRFMQKDIAADEKLEEAGIKEKEVAGKMSELTAREQSVARREQELLALQSAGTSQSLSDTSDVTTTDLDEQAEVLVDDLYSGDREKAQDAMKTILERTDGATHGEPEVTAEAVATIVEQREAAKSALKRFNTTYPGIKADSNLQQIVNSESIRIRNEHPEYSQEKLLMESGKFVAEKYGSKVVGGSGFQDKAERKSQTDTVAGVDATRMPLAEKEPVTRKQAIAELKQHRR